MNRRQQELFSNSLCQVPGLDDTAAECTGWAVAQTMPNPGDLEGSLDQHCEMIQRAGDHGAGLVLFPELSLTDTAWNSRAPIRSLPMPRYSPH